MTLFSAIKNTTAAQLLTRAAALGLDLVIPPRCLSCGISIARGGDVCSACWRTLTFIDRPICNRCGLPFEIDIGPQALCAPCLGTSGRVTKFRAALAYDEASKQLVLPFKHADRLDCAPAFARWMARAGAELLGRSDLITAVPLHSKRLLARRYNQAAVLALAIGAETGVPAVPDLLVRIRATPSQGGLSHEGRRQNVRGAFAPNPSRIDRIKGARILIVDDVHTTGASLEEAARTLVGAGAIQVDALTLCRVVRATDMG